MNIQSPVIARSDITDVAHALRGKVVLITGASGFIGTRLAERLLLECGARPRVLLRNHSRAARLARFDIDRFQIVLGTLADAGAVGNAVSGADVVFHCAYDPGHPEENLDGARILADACLKEGVRLVHVSTISVYEPLKDGSLEETSPTVRSGLPYSENKLDVEECILEAVRTRRLDATVVMPTIVYGPFCKPWTLTPAKQLASGTVLLPENGHGLCNAVHVDDVCQGMIRAAVAPNVKERKYFLSSAEPVTWQEFYNAFAIALDRPGPKGMSRTALEHENSSPLSAAKLLLGDPKRIIRWAPTRALAMWAKDNLSPGMKERVKQVYKIYRRVAPDPVYTPDAQQMSLFSARCRVSIDRARADLGYNPAYTFAQGIGSAAGWARWALSH